MAGELLVTYEAGTGNVLDSVDGAATAEVKNDLPDINAQLIEFPEVKGEAAKDIREDILAETKRELENDPDVKSVEYNYVYEFSFTPNDSRFGAQYGLKQPRFPRAWDTVRGKGVKIAVVDSGIAGNHPDLRRKIAAQRDFLDNDRRAEDPVGHGTHVAGVAAAQTNNGKGVAGGCPSCKLLIAKAGDQFRLSTANIARGINWSVNRGAKVINLSLGGPQNSRVLKNAVDRAANRGVVVVAAAGNEDSSAKIYPAAYKSVLAVTATNRSDKRARFSSFGSWVDVAAPGVDILSTYTGGKYRRFDGTSFSSPHVAALAGLLADQGRGRSNIRDRIQKTAVDKGQNGRDKFYGAGRINAAAAVRR